MHLLGLFKIKNALKIILNIITCLKIQRRKNKMKYSLKG
jgi:hypothetical protein